MTFPRVERDRLICVASFNLWPVAPVLACLSDPCVKKTDNNNFKKEQRTHSQTVQQ